MAKSANDILFEMHKFSVEPDNHLVSLRDDQDFLPPQPPMRTQVQRMWDGSNSKFPQLKNRFPFILKTTLILLFAVLILFCLIQSSFLKTQLESQSQILKENGHHLHSQQASTSNETKFLKESIDSLKNGIELVKLSTKNWTEVTLQRVQQLDTKIEKNWTHLNNGMEEFQNEFSNFTKSISTRMTQLEKTIENSTRVTTRFKNCFEIFENLSNSSSPVGIARTSNLTRHIIHPFGPNGPAVDVLCDFRPDEAIAWTVIQRRQPGGTRAEFYKNWADYEKGFGSVDGSYWIGLKVIRALTSGTMSNASLHVDLTDWENDRRYALYENFSLADSSDFYRLSVNGYSGTAGDSLNYHNGMRFSTKDLDNDESTSHCAQMRHGGWWYNGCDYSNLNGYYWNERETVPFDDGITWVTWKSDAYSLKGTVMMLRHYA